MTTFTPRQMENDSTIPGTDAGNNLFPVFVKLEELRLLIVGGGKIGLEKLQTVLANSPSTKISIVAPEIGNAIRELASSHPTISLRERPFHSDDLENADIAIVAVNNRSISEIVARQARAKGALVNVADTPDLCDFYLGSIVRKGHLKIAISTNGKSPTLAKRLKEEIGNMIPEEMDNVLDNMQTIRKSLNGDFGEKVRRLNELTSVLATQTGAPVPGNDISIVLAAKQERPELPAEPEKRKWQQVVKWCLFAFFFMLLGHAILSPLP